MIIKCLHLQAFFVKILIMNKVTLEIDDLDMFGLGIAHKDGKTIFVPNAITNETIEAEIESGKNNICHAKNLSIIKKSEFRATPLCKYYGECGGCDLQHLNYEKTLDFKKNQIKLAFKKIAGILLDDFEIVPSEKIYFYRNKIAMNIAEINSEKVLCLYKKNSHEPIKVDSCKLMDEKFDYVIKNVNEFLKTCPLICYNKLTKTGILKHLVCRIINDDVLLTFVVKNKCDLKGINNLYNTLKSKFNHVGINLNINNLDKDILSNNFMNLVGDDKITFNNLNINQQITNASFLQVNTPIAEKIYKYVLKNIDGKIVNAYSGAGLLSAIIAKNNAKNYVYGIEINKNATKLAEELKKNNKIENLTNFCGDAGEILNSLNLTNYNLILDPPRSGVDGQMLDVICNTQPNKIIYISCDKNSLAKNLKSLLNDYSLTEIKAFDMFPQTKNVETVVILSKK